MRRSHLAAGLALSLALVTVAACSGNGNANRTTNNVRTGPNGATYVPTAVTYTPIAASTAPRTPYPTPPGTPPVGAINPCVALSSGPQPPNPTLPPPTPIPPFTPGPQPQRPPIDLGKLQLSSGTVPQGYDPLNDGKVDAVNLAQAATYPQYAYSYLQTIGLIGGRALSWTGQPSNGRYPLLALYYFVFGNDAGASAFLQSPVFPANECVKPEQGPQIGQESRYDSFQYTGQLQTGNQGIFEGHEVLWRCGRVLISVQQVGAPNQFSAGSVNAIAQKVQSDFLKTQSCS